MAASRLLRCEPATDLLDDPTPQDLQSAIYWRLRIRNGAVVGVTDDRATRMVELMTRRRLPAEDETLNAFRENSVRGTSADVWGYRRPPIDWPRLAFELPSPASGMAAWLGGDDCDR